MLQILSQTKSSNEKITEIDVSKLPSAKEGETVVKVKETKQVKETKPSLSKNLKTVPDQVQNAIKTMSSRIQTYILYFAPTNIGNKILIAYIILFLLGLIFCIFRNPEYGCMLMAIPVCMIILTILLCAGNFGLPTLMDPARCSIYYAYLFPLAAAVGLDGVLYLLLMPKRCKVFKMHCR